ncbi:MAG: PilZ domain-containing protein, partial [Terriglobales bacterium]
VPVQFPVECVGSARYQARTLDICEGGMALKFNGRKSKESVLRLSFALPGHDYKFEIWGEMAWETTGDQAGVRFKDLTGDQRNLLRKWLTSQFPEPESDDPPVICRLTELSMAGCYLTTTAPFPMSTRIMLSLRLAGSEARASAIVRITHPEYGMGVEFLQSSDEQRENVSRLIESLRANGEFLDLHVEPEGLETAYLDPCTASSFASDDALVALFCQKTQLSVDAFLQQMQQQRQLQGSS